MRLDREHLGYASFLPGGHIIAGEISEWVIEFTVGKYGVDDGGNVRFAWRSVSDWEAPQFDDSKSFGHTTAKTDGDAELRLSFIPYERPFANCININVHNGFLKEGDKITLTLGDRSLGSPGIRAQTFCESNHEIKTLVDPFGTNRFEEADRICFSIISAYPSEIQAVIPGYEGTAFIDRPHRTKKPGKTNAPYNRGSDVFRVFIFCPLYNYGVFRTQSPTLLFAHITFVRSFPKKCPFSRYSSLYDCPRSLLNNLPGLRRNTVPCPKP